MAKLLFIHHSGIVGGAGVSLRNVLKTVAIDNDVTVYVSSQPDDMVTLLNETSQEIGIKVKDYGRRIGAITYYSGGDSPLRLRFWYRLSLIFKQWNNWNKKIAEENPDIVILNSKILSWMSLLPEIRKRKSICFVRETMKGKERSLLNRLISKMLNKFSEVIFLSDYDRKKEGLKSTKTEVIHNYVEESQFDLNIDRKTASEILGVKPDTFHVLYVGGVSEMKGFDVAVRAILQSGKDVELILAGNNFEDAMLARNKEAKSYAQKWYEYIKNNDTDGQIHLVGRQKNMSICYSACDVLLFPMKSPHQSRPAFEAGYFSKPVIITDFENITEFVRDGDNGYTVPADNIKVVSERICYLKNNPHICEYMGRNNRFNTDNLHNKEKNCELIKNIIKEMESL